MRFTHVTQQPFAARKTVFGGDHVAGAVQGPEPALEFFDLSGERFIAFDYTEDLGQTLLIKILKSLWVLGFESTPALHIQPLQVANDQRRRNFAQRLN